MKTYRFLVLIATVSFLVSGCKKEDDAKSERFILLTSHVWTSQTLEVNGIDASGPDGFLEDFVGDAKFNEDGTGNLGDVEGTWSFANNETQLVISSVSLTIPVTGNIVQLNETTLEITTSVPNPVDPLTKVDVRLVYVAK